MSRWSRLKLLLKGDRSRRRIGNLHREPFNIPMSLPRYLFPAIFALSSIVVEATEAECTVVVRSEPHTILINSSKNPYEFTRIDFDNGFRFAGQLLQDSNKLKTYAYFDSKDRYVLIHFNAESLVGKSCEIPLGENTVYSPRLENEMSYQCQLKCE